MGDFLSSLSKTSTTALIAIIWTIAGSIFMFYITFGKAHADTTIQTQVIQGLYGLLMLILGYYFGNAKKHKDLPE